LTICLTKILTQEKRGSVERVVSFVEHACEGLKHMGGIGGNVEDYVNARVAGALRHAGGIVQ
jgi:hypothetical protein